MVSHDKYKDRKRYANDAQMLTDFTNFKLQSQFILMKPEYVHYH
ncbi:hypothetical protein GNI_032110 [Gregarina niphandrodes]|uniref:Uncharacterized protein n=1 Tax=Gregarina niphandrodes TaxID=110365 RepID=A0A023BB49_GRENI|nr:hypothetical protein GNI_032110 [Gregarina niphandrodes]EZG78811.1 hypothetical protein GNI_032110 [Gregarina niphandrodes]|eukprot:XP_011129191.1 hypothetical protein GNI_032110 [Gregarina niphandrodes]